jgi:hypothetical protein
MTGQLSQEWFVYGSRPVAGGTSVLAHRDRTGGDGWRRWLDREYAVLFDGPDGVVVRRSFSVYHEARAAWEA